MDFFDLLIAPARLVPLIVGAIFLSIGLNIFLAQRRFARTAQTVIGHVVAIERYVSRSTSGNTKRVTTYYRPWVDFTFQGRPGQAFGSSVNVVRHRIGAKVPVQVVLSTDGRSFRAEVKDGVSWVFPVGFSLAGAIALFASHQTGTPAWIVASGAVLGVVIGHLIAVQIAKSEKPQGGEGAEDRQAMPGSVVFTDDREILRMLRAQTIMSAVFIGLLLVGGVVVLGYNWGSFPERALTILLSDPVEFFQQLVDGAFPSSWEKPIALNGIGAGMVATALFALISSRKKIGALFASPKAH